MNYQETLNVQMNRGNLHHKLTCYEVYGEQCLLSMIMDNSWRFVDYTSSVLFLNSGIAVLHLITTQFYKNNI